MLHPDVARLARFLPPPPAESGGAYQDQFPPPLANSGGDRFDWEDLAAQTGWRYPSDYRSFLEVYGAGGGIDDEAVWIDSPPPEQCLESVDRLGEGVPSRVIEP